MRRKNKHGWGHETYVLYVLLMQCIFYPSASVIIIHCYYCSYVTLSSHGYNNPRWKKKKKIIKRTCIVLSRKSSLGALVYNNNIITWPKRLFVYRLQIVHCCRYYRYPSIILVLQWQYNMKTRNIVLQNIYN